MNLPQIHTNLLWTSIAVLILLSISYLAIKTNLINGLLLVRKNGAERKNHMRGIICEIILYEQGAVPLADGTLKELKLKLWKLLGQFKGSKHLMTNILITLYSDFDESAKPIIYKLSEEFGLQHEVLDKCKSLANNSLPNTTTPDINNMDNGKLKDLESTMKNPNSETSGNNNLQDKGTPTSSTIGKGFNLDFVPIVGKVKGETDTSTMELLERLLTDHDMEFLMEFLELKDFEINPYEKIKKEFEVKKKRAQQAKNEVRETSFLNIDFLPIIYEIEEEIKAVNPTTDIYDMEVDCEVVIDPFIKKQISNILSSHVKEQMPEDTIIKEEDILDLDGLELPAAKFYSKRESKRVKLLHAIAELGDIREVALLSEMMDVEKNDSIADLIKEIIFKFLSEYPVDEEEIERNLATVDFGDHYVFKRLFNALDMESQLILLEEIEKIGEQHELDFIETLHHHSIGMIREKALSVSRSLEHKLGIEEDNQKAKQSNFKKVKSINSRNKTQKTALRPRKSINKPLAAKSNSLKGAIYSEYVKPNDIFKIDFDMSPPEKLMDSGSPMEGITTYMQQLEEIHFMEQLKELTNKLFRR